MRLSEHQWQFLQDEARLVLIAKSLGYRLTAGRLKQYEGDKYWTPTSSHNDALAIDLNLFAWRNGRWVYLSSTASHAQLGSLWEQLSPYNRSGCRFGDGNHYERLTTSRLLRPDRWGWFDQDPLWDDDSGVLFA